MSNKKKENAKVVIFQKRKSNDNGYLQIERTESFATENAEALASDGWFRLQEPNGEKEESTTTDLEVKS
jgi:hypothetical protein